AGALFLRPPGRHTMLHHANHPEETLSMTATKPLFLAVGLTLALTAVAPVQAADPDDEQEITGTGKSVRYWIDRARGRVAAAQREAILLAGGCQLGRVGAWQPSAMIKARLSGVYALGLANDKTRPSILLTFVAVANEDANEEVRQAAVSALGSIGE